jgi:hypothetical protein
MYIAIVSTNVPSSTPEQSRPRNPLEDPRYERERIPRPPFFGDPLAGDEPFGP